MTIAEIQTEQVTIHNQDLEIAAYLATPKAQGTYPAIIVIQEIFGVNAHIRDLTERIARQGYVAIAPAIYQRLAPGFETGYEPEDLAIGREYKNQTKATELLSDLEATIDYLYQLPQVKTTGVGTVGFCFGGHVVYLAATLGYTDLPLVSSDFRGTDVSSTVDGQLTLSLGGDMIKVVAWYDNEWGYSQRVVDLAELVASKW